MLVFNYVHPCGPPDRNRRGLYSHKGWIPGPESPLGILEPLKYLMGRYGGAV